MGLTTEQKKLAYELNKQGYSQIKIADLMDVSQPTISKAIKENKPVEPFIIVKELKS